MSSGSHYIALFLVVTIGVASGNLLSNELTARYAAYKLNEVTAKMKAERAEREEMRATGSALYQDE